MSKLLERSAVLGILVTLTVLATRSGFDRVSAGQPDVRDKLRWGVALQTERPFYTGGEMMRATLGAFNFSNEDAHGWIGSSDANGCAYRMTIENDRGEIVWEPWGRICGTPVLFRSLPSNGGRIARSVRVPLVYDNDNGVGTQGAPLPPGFYKVTFSMQFHGPGRVPGDTPLGLDYSASVPIQIE